MSGTGKINDFVPIGTSLMVEINKYLQEKDAKEYAQQSFENIREQNVELLEQIERLQEQLNEANEVIRFYKDPLLFEDKYNSPFNAIKYLEKWDIR